MAPAAISPYAGVTMNGTYDSSSLSTPLCEVMWWTRGKLVETSAAGAVVCVTSACWAGGDNDASLTAGVTVLRRLGRDRRLVPAGRTDQPAATTVTGKSSTSN